MNNPAKIFTGSFLWGEIDAAGIRAMILDGNRPHSPEGEKTSALTAAFWRIFTKCWAKEPDGRILVSRVLEHLRYL